MYTMQIYSVFFTEFDSANTTYSVWERAEDLIVVIYSLGNTEDVKVNV